jgi:hypothetical protein
MAFSELALIASQAGFQLIGNPGKAYFPRDWRDPEFKAGRSPRVVILAPK